VRGLDLGLCGCTQIPEAPAEAPIFMEDIPEDERDVMGFKKYGAGGALPHERRPCFHHDGRV
jgi:hypothetical protein